MPGPKIYSEFDRPPPVLEMNDGKSIVETVGFIPADVQIEQLINAGVRLDKHRKEAFDFEPGEDIDPAFEDPTRAPNFDLADASNIGTAVSDRLLKAQQEYEAAQAAAAEADKAKAVENGTA